MKTQNYWFESEFLFYFILFLVVVCVCGCGSTMADPTNKLSAAVLGSSLKF
jgi:hypothetical protein